ncbi:S1C family serine protease [uncultured Oscillibacter sp.]|uniref:S1C family serine protease n=2 Tax=uncultured Oscillibacter sp. TaxID=876091 RepID=UPI0025DBD6E3|nr:trypsin-like peptidase domain-containing protein [uncultured Oscillibacter sp.]
MKKRLLSLLCVLVLTVSVIPAASALEGEASRAADTLSTLGLIDSTYHLDAPATRAQAAVLLVRLAGAEQAAAADNWLAGFRDVPASIAQEVNYAARQGWITGVTATAFRPDAVLTANAWSAFLLRMLGYSDKAGDFTIADAAGFAQRIGLFPIAYTGTLTQGDLFEMAADALSFSYRDGSATVIGRLVSQGTVSRAAANALGLLTPALTARQVADRCAAAVFRLDTYETEAYRDEGLVTGEASGFFITEDGLAVTNYHSIADAVSATATLSTGDVYEVERVIYYDPDIDIAVIRVSRTALKGHDTSAFATLDIADSGTGDLRAGDTVYAIGNPLGVELRGTLTDGIVSAINRDVQVDGRTMTLVQTNAALNSGNSGGPLINAYGQVVGINTIKMSSDYSNVEGLGFAIPSASIRRLVNDLLTYGEVRPEPSFGVTVLQTGTRLEDDVWGLQVLEVTPGSAADLAGIREGDFILAAGGRPVETSQELLRIRRQLYVGDQVTMEIWRDGERMEVTLTLNDPVE